MPDRPRAWGDERFSATSVAAGTPFKRDLLANLAAADVKTAVRIIGELSLYGAVTSESEYDQLVDIGIGVASVEAFTVGGSSLPQPNVDVQQPPRGWMFAAQGHFWQFKAANNEQQRGEQMFRFDLRASRKVDRGVLYLAITNTNISGSSTSALVVGRVRVLCLT